MADKWADKWAVIVKVDLAEDKTQMIQVLTQKRKKPLSGLLKIERAKELTSVSSLVFFVGKGSARESFVYKYLGGVYNYS